jgi:cation:H+ antiporter
LTDILLLVLGLGVLIKSADMLVQGASGLAVRLGMSALAIGLTVVSFGTSLPEMLVTLTAGIGANADLAIANVIGSNIFNVLVVIGVAASIRPLVVKNSTVFSEIPFSLIAALLVGFLANAALFSPTQYLSISRVDGAILLFFFLLFVLYVFKISRDGERDMAADESPMPLARSWGLVLLGVVGLCFGGQWCVDGAVGVALGWGVNDALIGLTIVAAGTSAPELVTSAVAAYRGRSDLAIGNVIGSNIFNILWVLGLTATIVELPFEAITNTDIVMAIVASTLVLVAMVVSRRLTITRTHGILFLLTYLGYLAFVIQRG